VDLQRIFVDGHSVIYAWPELTQFQRRMPQRAREELVARLTQFQDATHIPVTLVFDGGKRAKAASEETSAAGVELLYSEPGETADAVIERRVAARARGTRVLVITNDRVEQRTVESFGAETMSAANFADWVEREQRQFGLRVAEIHKKARPFRKFP
jgi:predicted RNA-binding protein with PIN domain